MFIYSDIQKFSTKLYRNSKSPYCTAFQISTFHNNTTLILSKGSGGYYYFSCDQAIHYTAQQAVEEQQCLCSSCGDMLEDGSYCCSTIDVTKKLAEQESVDCITEIQRFMATICDESVLELLAYSVNRKGFPEKNEVEKRNKLFRFAAYRTFFGIAELNGLCKGRRFKLPTCVALE